MSALHGCLDKGVLLADHMSKVAHCERREEIMQHPLLGTVAMLLQHRTSYADPIALTASKTAFGDLRSIDLSELQLEHRHYGCRIDGTVCCQPIRHTAIQLLLEDPRKKADAVKVSIYNLLPASAPIAQVLCLLPKGTKLPYYKTYADGSSGIRVDNPADIVFLPTKEDVGRSRQSSSFTQCQARGNEAYR